MTTVTVRVLKDELSEYLRRAESGERVTVTRDGKPIAVVVPLRDVRGFDVEAVQLQLAAKGWANLPAAAGKPGFSFAAEAACASLSSIIIEERDDRVRG